MQAPIILRQVTKVYGKETILREFTHAFEEGKIHGIIGKNGSGKTTLLKLICGYVQPTSGEVLVLCRRIGVDQDFPTDVGVIIETPGFIPYYSGRKNLAAIAGIRGIISEERIRETLLRVGLDPDSRKHVGKYSMGMNQRLGLAQALMEDPRILLLDEPMNGLDKQGVSEMRSLFLELKVQGKTILLASHSAEDIDCLCDTVLELDQGQATLLR